MVNERLSHHSTRDLLSPNQPLTMLMEKMRSSAHSSPSIVLTTEAVADVGRPAINSVAHTHACTHARTHARTHAHTHNHLQPLSTSLFVAHHRCLSKQLFILLLAAAVHQRLRVDGLFVYRVNQPRQNKYKYINALGPRKDGN